MHFSLRTTIPLLALASTALSQTFTDCDPTKKECPADQGLGVSNYTIDFTQNMMSDTVWNTTAGSVNYGTSGAQFTINTRGDSPTVKSNFYIFFGTVEVIMKAAHGQGIVSSLVLQSDDRDEIDLEWIGGNSTYFQTNYYRMGNTATADAVWHTVDNPQDNFHNYTIDWSQDKIDWYVDSQIIRTKSYADADGGKNFPQTPCDVRMGIWAGGDPKNPNGTIQWAGGETNYNDAPFSMTVKSLRVADASKGTQYSYGDLSGTFGSIKISNDTKPLKLDGSNSQSSLQSATQKWDGLSKTNKIIIAAVVVGVLVVCAAVFAFCCIRQRRAGKHEKLVEDAKFEKDTAELLAYRAQMSRLRTEKLAEARALGTTPTNLGNGHVGASLMGGMSPNPNGPPGGYGYSQASLRSQNSGYAQSTYAQSVNSFGSRGGGGGGGGYQRY